MSRCGVELAQKYCFGRKPEFGSPYPLGAILNHLKLRVQVIQHPLLVFMGYYAHI